MILGLRWGAFFLYRIVLSELNSAKHMRCKNDVISQTVFRQDSWITWTYQIFASLKAGLLIWKGIVLHGQPAVTCDCLFDFPCSSPLGTANASIHKYIFLHVYQFNMKSCSHFPTIFIYRPRWRAENTVTAFSLFSSMLNKVQVFRCNPDPRSCSAATTTPFGTMTPVIHWCRWVLMVLIN